MPPFLPRRFAACSTGRESRRVRSLLLAAFLLSPVTWNGAAQTATPTDPPIQSPPGIPAAEPALPTDPTAPNTIQTSAAPVNPLIPAQPLPPLAPVPPSAPPPAQLPVAGSLPGGSTADPFAVPAATLAPPGAGVTKTDNIGTARRFQYVFALTLGATFDDNIFLESSGQRSDTYFTVQPSVSLGLGGGFGGGGGDNTLRFTYSPQALLYVDHSDLDAVQHFVSLGGTYHFTRLTLRGSQDVQILDSTDVGNPHPFNQFSNTPPAAGGADGGTISGAGTVGNNPGSNVNLDTGQRTRVNLYTTALTGNYSVSDKVSYDLSGQFTASDYAGDLLSSRTWSSSGFFNYSPTGKTTVGLGVSGGYVFSDRPNPDQSFEQGNLRLSYVPSFKLVFSGQVGLELRQSGDRNGNEVTPVFDLSLAYSPFDGTSISLTGNRQVQTSAILGGQDYRITGFTLGLSQRFVQHLFLRLNVGYSHSEYVSEISQVNATRTDDYFFVQPGMDYNLRDNLVVGGFYSRRSSSSSQSGRDFSDNQVGVRLTFSF